MLKPSSLLHKEDSKVDGDTEIEVICKEIAGGGGLAYDIAVGYVPTIIISMIVIVIFVIALALSVKTILGGKPSKG